MSETDDLRRLLDEFGVKHRDDDSYGCRVTYVRQEPATWSYTELPEGTTFSIQCECDLGAEDAVTVTLRDDDYERRMDELLCRLTNGKWSKSRSYSVDFMASCVDEAYEDAYDDSTFDRGECEDVWRYDPYAAFKCSACGTSRIELDKRAVRFCSNCGRRVKGGV